MASSASRKRHTLKISNQYSPARRDFRPACGEPHSPFLPSTSASVSRDRLVRNVVSLGPVTNSGPRKETPPGTCVEHNHGKEVSDSVSDDISLRRGKSVAVLNPAGVSASADGVRLNRARASVDNEQLNPTEKSREHVKSLLVTFWKTYNKLKEENAAKSRKHPRATIIKAAMTLESTWLNSKKLVGTVPGVEIGDRFQLRAEMNVIGLHRQFENGIDYMKVGGTILATSIVVTERYDNYVQVSKNSLTYIGHGRKPHQDQKLERGNLALKNSMEEKSPVRVIFLAKFNKSIISTIRGNSSQNNRYSEYVYDGLYMVDKCSQVRGKSGKLEFHFVLIRCADQSKISLGSSIKSRHRRMCVLIDDISEQKEHVPIRVVNSYDGERPPSFSYIANVINPFAGQPPLDGCDCDDGCSDSEDCVCKIKNGGGIPYNYTQVVTSRNSLIYECGPSCRCYESCINRVSQRGIRFELEIFKIPMGWGVRTRSYIPAGRFVCELVGEVHKQNGIAGGIGQEEYLFEVGNNYTALDSQQSSGHSSLPTENDRFIIDATRCGNVGRFIRHSSFPNLYVQKVVYDNSDVKMPHIMLFAMKDIPSQKELTWNHESIIN